MIRPRRSIPPKPRRTIKRRTIPKKTISVANKRWATRGKAKAKAEVPKIKEASEAAITKMEKLDAEYLPEVDLGLQERHLATLRKQRILIVGSYPKNPFPLWRGLEQATQLLGNLGVYIRYVSIDRVTDSTSSLRKIDPTTTIVVTTNPRHLAELAQTLRKLPGKRGLWHNDLRPVPESYTVLKGAFDRLFMCWAAKDGGYALKKWETVTGTPTAYMPQGSVARPWTGIHEGRLKVVFVGDTTDRRYHTGRLETVNALQGKIINSSQRAERIYIEMKSDTYYKVAHYSIAHSPQVQGYNSIRLYNILSSGGLLLVLRFPGIEKLLEHQKHAIIFGNPQEAQELRQGYDEHPEGRALIRKNGYDLFSKKHTIAHRIANMAYNLATDGSRFWGFL